MRLLLLIYLFILANWSEAQSSFKPYWINTSSGSETIGGDYFDYSIGEPVIFYGGVSCDSIFAGFQHLAIDTFSFNITSINVSGPLTFCDNDNVVLSAPTGVNYIWSTGALTQNITVGTSGNYSVSVFNTCGDSIGSNEIEVNVLMPPTQELCVVTTDSATGNHNVIIWEKPANLSNIDSFYVYREVSANVYTKIHAAHVSDTSVYEDFGANPNQQSWKYKISILDSCGNESDLSLYHESIHLLYLTGGNFQWNHYIIEPSTNPVSNYLFFKDDLGNGNWVQIGAPVNNSFTDVNYLSTPNARYRVLVGWNISCSPSRVGVNTSRSNIKNYSVTPGSVEENELLTGINVSPNPATNILNINYGFLDGDVTIHLYDGIGKLIQTYSEKTNQINIGDFESGIYTVSFETEYGIKNIKIIKD